MPLGANKAAIMGVAGTAAAGDVVLLQTQSFTDETTVSFTSGITSTYGEYIFGFYNIAPATDLALFIFQANASGGSGYNETMTTTFFRAVHQEDDGQELFGYDENQHQAQGTDFQEISTYLGNGADENTAGSIHIFNPSSTTYVKHFVSHFSAYEGSNDERDYFVAGYFNTTAALDEFQFKMSSGNFDGKIKLWGVK